MAHMIQMGGDTQTAIANGDIMKLKELLVSERKQLQDLLEEMADPHTVRMTQGKLQILKGIIKILPQ